MGSEGIFPFLFDILPFLIRQSIGNEGLSIPIAGSSLLKSDRGLTISVKLGYKTKNWEGFL
jgi:hypothetical protein